ncbi:MAG: single-stranded DNA-binding protein [Clostridia bacterium]|nr:single-stranded DNA-binding protein [Clostridia bacterium]
MNSVALIGRLTRDPEVRYSTGANQTAVARFTIAVDRERTSREGEQSADFISIVCFGKTAELVEKYVAKGRLVGVTGRIQTGSYEKDGRKVYTTDVIADRVQFLDRGNSPAGGSSFTPQPANNDFGGFREQAPDGFERLTDDDIPF